MFGASFDEDPGRYDDRQILEIQRRLKLPREKMLKFELSLVEKHVTSKPVLKFKPVKKRFKPTKGLKALNQHKEKRYG